MPEVVTNPKSSGDATEPGFGAAGRHKGEVQVCDFAVPADVALDGGAIVGFVAKHAGVKMPSDLQRAVPALAGFGTIFGIARMSQNQHAGPLKK